VSSMAAMAHTPFAELQRVVSFNSWTTNVGLAAPAREMMLPKECSLNENKLLWCLAERCHSAHLNAQVEAPPPPLLCNSDPGGCNNSANLRNSSWRGRHSAASICFSLLSQK
jgi:hypothetical protein